MYIFSRINHLRVRSEQAKVPIDEQNLIIKLAKKILDSPLKILAIDFDKTLIDDDSGRSMSFENIYIRNQFFWLIKYLMQHKWICIASFNENTPTKFNEHLGIVTQTVVRRLLKITDKNISRHSINKRLADQYKIIIQSYPSRSYGKIEHIQSCIEQIQEISAFTVDIQPFHVALFDDNEMNIKEAKKYFPAVLIPVNEFNAKLQTIEPMIPLIDQITKQAWNEYEKIKTKRKYSRGDRLQRSES
ncbi:unnamed protein product [Rotaria socialis]|uniref:Uncharacterized protein n=1 Tax=Rotaria socialis TaxID=392032 RepID=A0A820QE97_9BILA|nr:unnamed protein product [Rotaria socialis]CAF3416945.1 unnamed protein product [Rotaria socialis]CAF3450978.1 unnamed protein product [Rotaria socialis]CAF3470332.1 unnamed protein product [Rotaria socialis]CAF3735597.1 unnamed protein product [Rotaria socialis]